MFWGSRTQIAHTSPAKHLAAQASCISKPLQSGIEKDITPVHCWFMLVLIQERTIRHNKTMLRNICSTCILRTPSPSGSWQVYSTSCSQRKKPSHLPIPQFLLDTHHQSPTRLTPHRTVTPRTTTRPSRPSESESSELSANEATQPRRPNGLSKVQPRTPGLLVRGTKGKESRPRVGSHGRAA